MPNKNILKHHEALKSRKTQSLLPRLIAGWQKDEDGEWFRGVLVASTDTEEVLDLYEKDILAADLAKTIAEQAKQIAAMTEAGNALVAGVSSLAAQVKMHYEFYDSIKHLQAAFNLSRDANGS